MSVIGKVRKVLGILTDFLLVGRNRGWWNWAGFTPQVRDPRSGRPLKHSKKGE